MRYDVRLRLSYAYQRPVGDAHHLVRVQPRELPGIQHVEDVRVRIDPAPSERTQFDDYFGNPVLSIALRPPHRALEVEMRAHVRVERDLAVVVGEQPGPLPEREPLPADHLAAGEALQVVCELERGVVPLLRSPRERGHDHLRERRRQRGVDRPGREDLAERDLPDHLGERAPANYWS